MITSQEDQEIYINWIKYFTYDKCYNTMKRQNTNDSCFSPGSEISKLSLPS